MNLSQFFNFLSHPQLPPGGGGSSFAGGDKPWINMANSQSRGPGFDWRLQLSRLGAALQDASPGSHGGHLDAIDNRRFELQDARAHEDRQRRQLNAWADSMGLSPSDRMLLNISPEQFFRLYGESRVGQGAGSDPAR